MESELGDLLQEDFAVCTAVSNQRIITVFLTENFQEIFRMNLENLFVSLLAKHPLSKMSLVAISVTESRNGR